MFYYIWGSNFDNAVNEAMQDMCVSTGALMIKETGNLNDPDRDWET